MDVEEKQLEKKYREILVENPLDENTWINEAPATPFVGDKYGVNGLPKVLVYGSAENLNYDYEKPLPPTRNRDFFKMGPQGTDKFFPRIHITPITDGSLLTAARYLLEIFNKEGFSTDPKDFLQQIAVSNYGKFSQTNGKDYASTQKLLDVSHRYVEADMEVLQPEIVILPKTIHDHAFKGLLTAIQTKPNIIWTIRQTGATSINCHVGPELPKVLPGPKERSGWAREWVNHVPGKRMGLYLDWLDWRKQAFPGWLEGK